MSCHAPVWRTGSKHDEHVEAAVLIGRVLAAVLAGALLRARSRRYVVAAERERVDTDADGVPDVYEGPGACGRLRARPPTRGERADAATRAVLAPASLEERGRRLPRAASRWAHAP